MSLTGEMFDEMQAEISRLERDNEVLRNVVEAARRLKDSYKGNQRIATQEEIDLIEALAALPTTDAPKEAES